MTYIPVGGGAGVVLQLALYNITVTNMAALRGLDSLSFNLLLAQRSD